MGSYGVGISRLMGTVAELSCDNYGIIWPKDIAPFAAHLVYLPSPDKGVKKEADKIYNNLSRLTGQQEQIEILYDDRTDLTAGEKFQDADLIGMPVRIVVSERTVKQKSVEFKKRSKKNTELCSLNFSVILQKILE